MLSTNQYFDGKVVSIGFQGEALPATVGVIAEGSYDFDTSKKEVMTVISGELAVKLPGESSFSTFTAGQSFIVAANETFSVQATSDVAYLCTYE